jgi:hypothetical protein
MKKLRDENERQNAESEKLLKEHRIRFASQKVFK